MKKKILWIYMASVFVLFLAVGFIARQWWVGADTYQNVLADIDFKDSTMWLQECSRSDKCPIMDIICDRSGQASYTSTEDCIIRADNSYCRSANLQENATNHLNANQLRNFATHIENTSTDPSSCVVLHELAHACDKSVNDQNRNKMCSEVGAEQAEFACRRKIIDRICTTNPTNSVCTSACQDFQEKLPAAVWDTCMCAGSSSIGGVDNSVCCSCLKECKNITYYNKLMPASCGKLNPDVLNRACDYASSGSTHNCAYYAVGARDESKVCKFYDFNSQVCERTVEYFEETKDKAQIIADNECKNSILVYPGGEADEAVYSRAILNYVKNMICADCELSGEGKCSRPDRCMVSAGYIKYTCIDKSCDQGGTTPVKVRGIRNALNPTSANVGTSTGTPLVGMSLYAQRKNEFYQMAVEAPRIFLGTTDESGTIETSLTLGRWEIIAQKDGYQTFTQVVTVERNQPLNLNINMISTNPNPPPPPPVVADKTLNINVRDAVLVSESRPVYGAIVKITKGTTNFTQTTPNTGDISFPNLESGTWTIEVTKPGYALSPTSPTTVSVASPTNQANIVMERATGTLSIETTDKTLSTRVPGVSVTIKSDNITKTQVTDSNGSATFTDLLENREWTLTGTKSGYHQEEPSTAHSNGYGRVIMDLDTRNLTVRVKTTSGTNMANVQVKVSGPSGTVTKTTASNGEAVFNIKTGSNTVTLVRSGWEVSPNQTTTVDLQENLTKDLVMQRTKNLTVKVRTTLGTNMANVTVNLSGPDGTITKTTNTNGEASFTDLKVGQRTITLSRSGWATSPNQSTTFDLQANMTKNLTMQRAGNFKFSIKGRTLGISTPLNKATVKLCNKPLNDSTKVCKEQTTNLTGTSTFTDYAPGTYYYEARANNYNPRTGSINIVKQTTRSATVQLEKR